jgi:uncharacterized membrane protein
VPGEGLIGEPPIGSTRVSMSTQTRKARRLRAGHSEKESGLMAVLVVLLASLVLFGGLGALGVDALSTPGEVVAWAMAAMFAFTASAHFVASTRGDLVAMVPRAFPKPALLVSLTGILQGLGAVGLLIPATRGLAGLCLVLLLVAMLPANVSAARRGVPMRGRAPTPLWLRIPMQLLFIGLTWWATQA